MDPDNNNTNPMPGNGPAANPNAQPADITIPPADTSSEGPIVSNPLTSTEPVAEPVTPIQPTPSPIAAEPITTPTPEVSNPTAPALETTPNTLETPATPEVSSTSATETPVGSDAPEAESPLAHELTPLADNQPISFGSENAPDDLTKDAISDTPELGTEASVQPVDGQSTKDAEAKPAILTEESSAPLTPAAPVPGSIGSSTSFGAKPAKKKLPIVPIILLVVLLLIAAGGGAYYYFNFMNKPAKSSAPTSQVTPQVVNSTLTCNLVTKPDQSKNDDASIATKTDHKIVANYEDDQLVEYTDRYEATYATSAAAMTALEAAKKDYDTLLKGIKLEKDPFTSEATRKDSTIIVSHIAKADQITTANAPLLGLAADSKTNKVTTDYKSLKSAFETRKYTCKYE